MTGMTSMHGVMGSRPHSLRRSQPKQHPAPLPAQNSTRERGLVKRGDIWHINKIYRGIPIRKSTHQTDRTEAERVLIQHLAAIDQGKDFGLRPKHLWKEAAAKYLAENQAMPSIQDAAMHLAALDPYIGHLPLEQIHDHTLQKFIVERRKHGKNVQAANGVSPRTINMALELVGRILRQAASSGAMSWD
jgi:hypothetical protein